MSELLFDYSISEEFAVLQELEYLCMHLKKLKFLIAYVQCFMLPV